MKTEWIDHCPHVKINKNSPVNLECMECANEKRYKNTILKVLEHLEKRIEEEKVDIDPKTSSEDEAYIEALNKVSSIISEEKLKFKE